LLGLGATEKICKEAAGFSFQLKISIPQCGLRLRIVAGVDHRVESEQVGNVLVAFFVVLEFLKGFRLSATLSIKRLYFAKMSARSVTWVTPSTSRNSTVMSMVECRAMM